MTNHWADIGNSSLVVVWGANPSENHPACMAHINRARFPERYFPGTARANKAKAELIVIDPRKSRTALQADLYVRIRPGTDIAFANGLLKYMIDKVMALPAGNASRIAFLNYLNVKSNGTFFTDGFDHTGAETAGASVLRDGRAVVGSERPQIPNQSKYTDARFIINAQNTDYDRETIVATTGLPADGSEAPNLVISNFPKKAASCDAAGVKTVFNEFRDHLAPYDAATTADICGCTAAELAAVGDKIIANSRCSSVSQVVEYTDRPVVLTVTGGQGDSIPLWATNVSAATGQTDIIVKNATTLVPYVVGTDVVIGAAGGTIRIKLVGEPGGPAVQVPTATKVLVTYKGTVDQAPQAGYRSTTLLYAMGITQHTCGSANVKTFANIQGIMGNMGRSGGGINALRGIHNVQGSTDMGLLYGNIPGYSGNPSVQYAPAFAEANGAATHDPQAFGKYMDALWGLPLNGTGTRATMDWSYNDAYDTGAMQLQQRGFYNMTLRWFGDYATVNGVLTAANRRAAVDQLYSLWPKGNGKNHIQMFRNMAATPPVGEVRIKNAVVWGQNPAITEPNQSAVRKGLEDLEMLVVVDMFGTETAMCKRNGTGVTYLLPASSHVEKAGSASNSGRVLQWRSEAVKPLGNSKDDIELMLRFAKKLDEKGAFDHITAKWAAIEALYPAVTAWGWDGMTAFQQLYAKPYTSTAINADGTYTGGFSGTSGYDAITGTGDKATPAPSAGQSTTYNTAATLTGSEWAAEKIFREWADGVGTGGTIWIYTEGYNSGASLGGRLHPEYSAWAVRNRAKSRDSVDPYGNLNSHKWGYSWLVNRRVLYNNNEVVGDQADFFMSPDSVIRLFSPKDQAKLGPVSGWVSNQKVKIYNYARWYRTIQAPTKHIMVDMPVKWDAALSKGVVPPATVHRLPGRFPSHVEPYETPRPELAAIWGYNTTEDKTLSSVATGTASVPALNVDPALDYTLQYRNLVKAEGNPGVTAGTGTPIGTFGEPIDGKFPLVLTTIRCVEHFQGGPITRNNPANVEAEPWAWIEINSIDAMKYGITDGQWVEVETARGNSTTSQTARTANYTADAANVADKFARGFKARVGVGLQSNQRVAPGVVAIPWHYGDRGLATGSRANDLTIDAFDANTTIPEYKACLCKIKSAADQSA